MECADSQSARELERKTAPPRRESPMPSDLQDRFHFQGPQAFHPHLHRDRWSAAPLSTQLFPAESPTRRQSHIIVGTVVNESCMYRWRTQATSVLVCPCWADDRIRLSQPAPGPGGARRSIETPCPPRHAAPSLGGDGRPLRCTPLPGSDVRLLHRQDQDQLQIP